MADFNRTDQIVPLDQLDDFKVADYDPDVRGWEVVGIDGRRVGEVDHLLVDRTAMKVRYLDVDVEDGLTGGRDHHVLIPIGYARILEDDRRVQVDALAGAALAGLPPYTHGVITREYETDLTTRFGGPAVAATAAGAGDFYGHKAYDDTNLRNRRPKSGERMTLSEEQLAVGTREREAGAVEVRKEVDTRHVRKEVPVRHEEVVVERHAAPPGATGETRIEEGEIRVPVTEEELVVAKRTVPREELVVKKREVVETETVEADLRRERAEVERKGEVDIRDRGR